MSGSRKQAKHAASVRNQRRRADIERRRQNARRLGIEASAVSYRRRRLRRRVLIVAGALALLLVALVFVRSRREPEVSKSMVAALVDDADGALTITDAATAYTVTYRVDTYADDGTDTVTTQDFAIRRPFDAHIVGKADAPPGGTEQWSISTSSGLYQQSTQSDGATAQVSAPATALGDYRLDASLSDLVAEGTFVLGERRTLLGRECQVYRTGSPLESYTVTAPTATDYSDVCIDGAGLMLEELSIAVGEVTQRQVATAVDPAADLDDDTFAISATPADLAGGGSELEEIDTVAAPLSGFWSLSEPPEGYELEHRYVLRQNVTDTSADTSDTTATTAANATVVAESYIDVFVDGTNVVTVRQGPASADPGFDSSASKDVTTSNLGTVKAVSGVSGSVVSATPTSPTDWFILVTGTIPRTDLLAIVEQLGTV